MNLNLVPCSVSIVHENTPHTYEYKVTFLQCALHISSDSCALLVTPIGTIKMPCVPIDALPFEHELPYNGYNKSVFRYLQNWFMSEMSVDIAACTRWCDIAPYIMMRILKT